MERVFVFIKKNILLSISLVLAIITCFFVPINKEYINYFDFRTLACLLCILTVVSCLKNANFFQILSTKIIYLFKNTRNLITGLVLLTFVFDLVLANDMSLITLLPLSFVVLDTTDNLKYLSFTLVLQTIAANMSGMIVPHGNPQNLYLYSYFNIPTLEFMQILFPQFITVFVLLVLCRIFIDKKPLALKIVLGIEPDKRKTIIYLLMFVFSLAIIFRFVPYIIGTIIILILAFILDRKSFKDVDYGLLLTFCAFFVFSGNMSNIGAVNTFITNLIDKSVILAGIISCQFISNVPTAVLLSRFTENYRDLIIAVNIGSLGTMISSLASLITLKEFLKHKPNKFWSYLGLFTIVNLFFLIVLLAVTYIQIILK